MGVNCYFLGNVDSCGSLKLNAPAPEQGKFTLLVTYLGGYIEVTREFELGEPLEFSVKGLNEQYCFFSKLLNSAGDEIHINYKGKSYCQFKFCTSIDYTGEGNTELGTVVIDNGGGQSTISTSDLNFRHAQFVASSKWLIDHNLGKHPSVTIISSSGENVIGEVKYINLNQLEINFTQSLAGDAYLN